MAVKLDAGTSGKGTNVTGTLQRKRMLPLSVAAIFHMVDGRLWTKPAIIVLFWSFVVFIASRDLISTYSGLRGGIFNYSSIGFAKWSGVVFCCATIAFPVTGWATDIFIGRYRIIKVSLRAIWVGSILLSFFDVLYAIGCINKTVFKCFGEISHIVGLIGCIGFQSNIVQFNLDQLIDISSEEIMSFIRIFVWTGFFAFILVDFLNCFKNLFTILPVPIVLTLALCIDILFNKLLIKEPVTHNPLKLIVQVLKYALKNKYPRLRSAFTYWEDKPYSRIDLGKTKFGGPFTTEQVEDVKTFFRVMGIIYLCTLFVGVALMAYYVYVIPVDRSIAIAVEKHTSLCLQQLMVSRFGFVVLVTGFLFFECVCHPLAFLLHQKFRILTRIVIGMGLILLSLTVMMALDITQDLKYDMNSQNCTIKLHASTTDGVYSENLYWTIFPIMVFVCGYYILSVSGIDFLCAQTPYTMKGLMVGFMYSSSAVNILVAYLGLVLPFQYSWKYDGAKLSCRSWYLFCSVLVAGVIFVVFLIAKYRYKSRLREDHPPSLQYFAERYYDSSYNS